MSSEKSSRDIRGRYLYVITWRKTNKQHSVALKIEQDPVGLFCTKSESRPAIKGLKNASILFVLLQGKKDPFYGPAMYVDCRIYQ